MEPLTPAWFLSDMTGALPGYTESVARAFKALAQGIRTLSKEFKKFKMLPLPATVPHLSAGVEKGIPYFIRCAFLRTL